jgi:hypothetical protein
MHFDFHFSAVQVLWTLTFAALLVLIVVLMGRDRVRRFPWFTFSIVLTALRLLTNRLLHDKLPPITMAEIAVPLMALSGLVGLLVLVEMARYAFRRASARAWLIWGLVLLAMGAVVLWKWGQWPNWKVVSFDTPIAKLQLMQLLAIKTGLLTDVLAVLLGLLIVAFGARYGAGWRSHVQRIMIGLSTASLAQIASQAILEIIARHTVVNSREVYERLMNLQDKLLNTTSLVYVLVLIWWIVSLWIDEPAAPATVETAPAAAGAEAIEAPPATETGEV